MSKSLGNFITISDVINRGHSPRTIRYALLAVHYRQRLDFSADTLSVAASTVERIDNFIQNLRDARGKEVGEALIVLLNDTRAEFEKHMDDDLNIAPALGALFTMMKNVNVWMSEGKVSAAEGQQVTDMLKDVDRVLGIMSFKHEHIDKEIQTMIDQRNEARKKKNWAEADRIRKDLEKRGIVLMDREDGTIWRREKVINN
jgi:cysteinyl-tRNA synthetase